MRRQYLDLKASHPGAILFFRLGDFYETFDEDAETCARLLQITLTGREMGRGVRVPMAGVPAHAVHGYLARLVQAGRTVAICDQVEEPRGSVAGRGMMARAVTRVVTPGTIIEAGMLEGRRNNYLVAVVAGALPGADRPSGRPSPPAPLPGGEGGELAWGLAYADVSTGEFRCTQVTGPDAGAEIRRELERLDPAECIVPAVGSTELEPSTEASACAGRVVTAWDGWRFEVATATELLRRRFGVATLAGYGLEGMPMATRAAGALVAYLDRTHGARVPSLDGVSAYSPTRYVRLDPFTRRNLELDSPARGNEGRTLVGTVDETRTPPGGRLLRRWFGQPLGDVEAIRARHDVVAGFVSDGGCRGTVRALLGTVSDIERIGTRAAQGSATPRDLHALCQSLGQAGRIAIALRVGTPGWAATLGEGIDECAGVQDLIVRAIHREEADRPDGRGAGATGGARGTGDPLAPERLIRPGHSAELDDLIAGVQEARHWIAALEGVERARTGIGSLKVGYNRVFGYYLHVPSRYADRVPADYVRRQTLADGERHVTPELKAKEEVVLEAAATIEKVERRAFDEVLATIAAELPRLRATAMALAEIDACAALAEVAVRRGYVRPEVDNSVAIEIVAGRHPVVEASLEGGDGGTYVPNDCAIDGAGAWATILTGPNMAGKSTYLRSVALIVLMAQAGSFVPAARARIGVVDRIFTRVGAHDDLAAGRSTFMVEMVEAAQILRHATRRSLVVLDEIGRGTSTHDGLAIAQAVVEHLHERGDDAQGGGGRPRVLFATHFHELAALEGRLPGVANARLDVLEEGDRVTFLHRVVPGAAGRSYGIHVARLAGMPRDVTDRAALLLGALEARGPSPLEAKPDGQPRVGVGARRRVAGVTSRDGPMQLTLFAPPSDPVAEAVRAIDVDTLTPLEALNILARLRDLARAP